MQCGQCNTLNRAGRRFCSSCGAPLSLSCAACGFVNEADERYCGGCGIALAVATGAASTSLPATPAPAAAERRQVTIFFADLSGYTRLTNELDAEEVHELASRFFATADQLIQSYDGTVVRHLGDAVMALFGAPLAHSDDAVRAVRVALALHDSVKSLSEEIGRELKVHIGIASGQVVADSSASQSLGEYSVTGESVNLASRLYDMAAPGETLLSDAAYRSASHVADCEVVKDVSIKGFERPIRVWRLLGLDPGGGKKTQHPLIGRRMELEVFTSAIRACVNTNNGQAIYIRGDAGIGKSRLVEEFQALAQNAGLRTHKGFALDFGAGAGQDAIATVIRSLIGVNSSDSESVSVAAERVFGDGLLSPERRVYLNDLLQLPQPAELRAVYEAMDHSTRILGRRETVSELVRRLSDTQPLLIMVEDIHWADPRVLEHLESLTRTVQQTPVLLIMTSRTDGDPIDRARASGPLMTIDLGPLRQHEALEFAAAYIDATNRFAEACIERAEGNPLFLEQLLRGAEDSAETGVPGSIQSIVLARMDTLSAVDKQALQAASVIGQRYSLELLRHLVDNPHYTCERLVEHFLVRPEGEHHLFVHALIRDGAYGSLLKSKRRELHRRAADWAADFDLTLRAEHLERADDPSADVAYLEAARAEAMDYHYKRAQQLVERGLALAQERSTSFELSYFHGELLSDLGAIDRSIAAYERALAVADDDVQRARAHIGLGAGLRIVDRYDEALENLQLAEASAGAHNLDAELAQICRHRGNIYFPLGQLEKCLEQHGRARKFAQQAGSPESEAHALSGLGDANYQRGRMVSAGKHYGRCLELAREHGFGRIEVANQHMLGLARFYQNELRTGLQDCLAGADGAAKVGQKRAEMAARSSVGPILYELGDLVAAREQSELGLALARQLGARRFEPLSLLVLARVLLEEGKPVKAVEYLNQAWTIASDTGVTFAGPWVLGTIALASSDATTKAKALQQGSELLGGECLAHNYLWFYRDAMDVALGDQAWHDVERYACALESYTRIEPLPWATFFISRAGILSAYGRDIRNESSKDQLEQLCEQGRRAGFETASLALEKSLAES